MKIINLSKTIYKEKSNNYVYLVTELDTGKKYIGVRSCNIDPIEDLGKKYYTTSSNKQFIINQKK